MTKIKRLICACLTVVLLVSALPMHAFAQDVDAPPSAVQTAENGQDEVAGDPVVEPVDPSADEPAASIDTTGPPEATAAPDTDTESDSAEPTKEPSAEKPEVSAPVPSATPDDTSAPEQTEPTETPTAAPTQEPSASSTAVPTPEPTATPTAVPTPEPTAMPTAEPTSEPTSAPEVPSVPDPFVPNSTILEDADLGMKHAWPVPGNFTLTQKYSADHRAWDIAAAEGSPVAATDQGKIIVTQIWNGIVTHGDNNSYGNMVEIRHPNGSVTLYAHLSEINVSVGDTVVAGQQIGRVGQTGNATGPHLHFEIITENGKVDPAESGYFDYETMSIARYDPQDVYDAFMGSDGKPKGTKTLSDFGVTREKVVELLSSHDSKSDNFFLGTAYNPSDYYGYSGTDWQSPNGDTSYNGYAGMNCAGFASYVLRHAGLKVQQVLSIMKANPHANYALPGNYDPDYNLLAGANNWYNFAVDAGLVGYVFCDRKAGDGVDDAKQQLLKSGLAEKGDVVIMIWSDQPLSDGADNHIGFFWGDNPSEDKFWHSSHTDSSVTLYKGVRYGNQISQIQAKSEGATYVLLKYAESKFDIHLTKTSADVSLTKGNSNYTLKGAEYGVYASKSDARNGQKEIASFKTDSEGKATLSEKVANGTYYVKEKKAPKGYVLDETIYTVKVSGADAEVKVQDDPSRVQIVIKKRDAESGAVPQGDATLAGAVFRISYQQGGKTVVQEVTTNSDGVARLGKIPLGDITVQEITAPKGYVLDSTPHNYTLNTSDGVTVEQELVAEIQDGVVKGRVKIIKKAEQTDGSTTPEPGAVFEVYLRSAGSYANAKDTERDLLTTDAAGAAISRELPYGDYIVHQRSGGSSLELVDDFTVHVSDSGEPYEYELTNKRKDTQLKIVKTSDDGIVAGIKFRVTRLSDNRSFVYTTDADGTIMTEAFPIYEDDDGTRLLQYRVEEIEVPERYVQPPAQIVTLRYEEIGTVHFHNNEKRFNIVVTKTDADTGAASQGSAVFAGAVYGVYKDGELLDAYTVGQDGTFLTKEYICGDGYTLREITPPKGYTLSDAVIPIDASAEHFSMALSQIHVDVSDSVIRGGLRIEKRDAETELMTPQGSATLDGTQFEIRNLSDHPVVVGGESYEKDEVVLTVTVKDGIAQTAADALPYGHYSWQEVKVGSGYLLTDGAAREFDIREDGKLVEYREDNAAHNQVIRGDIDFIKVAEDDMHRLVHVPFRLTSETTGESHILVTDANGYVSTEASWNPHTVRTNINDTVPDGGTADLLAGVWFGADAEPDDNVGALPYDTYTLEELRCEANAGYDLITVKGITVSRHTRTVHLGTIDDRYVPQPEIWTAAHGKNGEKTLFEDEHALLIDVLTYTNLPKRELVVRGVVMDKATGKPIMQDGEQVTAEKRITPRLSEGSVEMEYTLDTTGLGGHDLVVFEYVYEADGSTLVAEHADLEDEDQTLTVIPPEIGTTAYVGASTEKTTFAVEEVTVRDIVHYKNLVPGKTVRVEGVLMNKETGNPFLVQGKEVTSTVHFTPDDSEGSVEVPFVFNVPVITQTLELVVFEEMYREHSDTAFAVHADIADQEQTVTLIPPEIRTQASDGADGDKTVFEDSSATLIDTVHFKHLPEQAFVLRGILMDKNTGRQLVQDDKPVTAELRFTPESPDGTVEMQYSVDTTGLGGHDLVVFEYLYTAEGEEPVAEHADLEDEDQTLTVIPPEIGTTAYVGDSDEQVAAVTQTVVIRDVVHYSNLVPGKTVRVEGTLMDKETGNPFLVHGEKVTSTVHFAPDSSEGEIEITFEFDGVEIAKKHTRLVVFESVYWEDSDTALAVHADIADTEQTVELLPIRGNVQVRKTNAHDPNQLLSGAVFAVYDDRDGDGLYNPEVDVPVDMLTESEPGVYGLSDLLYGSYLIHEEQGIEGFVRDDTYYPFMITVNGETVLVETETGKGFANKPIFGTVRVEKVNADTLERLSGAEFAVYKDRDGDGKYNPGEDVLYGTLEESDKGIYTLDQLPYGAYLLHEEVAPDGFQRDDQYYAFSIQDDGQTVIVENTPGQGFTNQPVPTPEIPQTGDNTNLGFWLSLGAVALGGLIGTLFLIYKRKDDD